jgi:hypothetical protein
VKYHIGEGVYVEIENPFEIILTTEQANLHGVRALTNIIILKPEMLNAIETIYSREAANITAKLFEESQTQAEEKIRRELAKKANQGS